MRFNPFRKQPNKKADVAEHPKVIDHVGLLINQPLGHHRPAKLLFIWSSD